MGLKNMYTMMVVVMMASIICRTVNEGSKTKEKMATIKDIKKYLKKEKAI